MNKIKNKKNEAKIYICVKKNQKLKKKKIKMNNKMYKFNFMI
jgi:hypothetical protein